MAPPAGCWEDSAPLGEGLTSASFLGGLGRELSASTAIPRTTPQQEPLQEEYHLLPFPSSKLQEASGKGFLRVSLTSLPVDQPMEVPRPDFHPRFPLKGASPRGISGPSQARGPSLSPPFHQRESHSDLRPCLLLFKFPPFPRESGAPRELPPERSPAVLPGSRPRRALGPGTRRWRGGPAAVHTDRRETEARFKGAGAQEPGLRSQLPQAFPRAAILRVAETTSCYF